MPMFKKSGGKIFAVQFNKAEERALDQEIKKQIVENDRAFDMDKESSILWMLHTQFGFGPKRLNRCFFSRGWNSVWNRYGIDVFSISVPHENP